jgi:predicted O-methyltransferase YrrM
MTSLEQRAVVERRVEFTFDWTSYHFAHWRKILAPFRGSFSEALEIGSWEGRSASFFLDFLPTARLTCVDPFEKIPVDVEARFDRNTERFGNRIEKVKEPSWRALPRLLEQGRSFDLIYIDGSHTKDDVMLDSLLSWRMLRRGGIIMWDDFLWCTCADHPAPAIRAFLRMHRGEFEGLRFHHQVIIRRGANRLTLSWHLQRLRTEAKYAIKRALGMD